MTEPPSEIYALTLVAGRVTELAGENWSLPFIDASLLPHPKESLERSFLEAAKTHSKNGDMEKAQYVANGFGALARFQNIAPSDTADVTTLHIDLKFAGARELYTRDLDRWIAKNPSADDVPYQQFYKICHNVFSNAVIETEHGDAGRLAAVADKYMKKVQCDQAKMHDYSVAVDEVFQEKSGCGCLGMVFAALIPAAYAMVDLCST